MRHCPWMSPDTYDWIYQAPAISVLALNLVFLVMIMWVSNMASCTSKLNFITTYRSLLRKNTEGSRFVIKLPSFKRVGSANGYILHLSTFSLFDSNVVVFLFK